MRPVLVLALDGASFDVIDEMVARDRLPNLAKWMQSGQAARLPSTIPPVTFPAWSSFMTGLPPAEHGIFDFTQKSPGAYKIRFVNSTDRKAPSLMKRVSEAGGDVLVLGLPATYPPESVNGLLVCGFDAPVSAGTDEKSASDPALYRGIAARVGPWMRPELNESAQADDFHERAVDTLLARIDRKRDFALEALARMRTQRAGRAAAGAAGGGDLPTFSMIVFSESDTAGHHYWRDHDPASPRHDPLVSEARRGALRAVYERLDSACGALREAAGPEALCVVLSDHGMGGASDKIVHLNGFLAERGFLVRDSGGGRWVDRAARGLRDLALAWLPARLAQQVFRRLRGAAAELESRARFGGFDWTATRAFSEEANTNPGIWINLEGRERAGSVAPADYERVRDEVLDALAAWRLPSGKPVVRRAFRREEIHAGKFCERVPDIVIELALDDGYGLSLVPTPWHEGDAADARTDRGIPSVRTLSPDEFAGGRGRGMNGTHRREGIWIADGPVAQAEPPPASLERVAPWLARAMGLAWGGAEGGAGGPGSSLEKELEKDLEESRQEVVYDADEEAMVAERLRALGYLE